MIYVPAPAHMRNTMTKPSDEEYRTTARVQYADDNLEIDDRAIVSHSDDGAWVAAWVWVDANDVETPAS